MYQTVTSNPRAKILFIVIILIVAWSGYLDRRGEQLTGDAITQAGIIYATARGINSLVSVLQTTTISPIIASVSVGELLDPINDMIERFSTVMTWSIGSLVMQKILAGIVSKSAFQVLLSIAAALAVAGLFVRRVPILNRGWQLFILVALARFSIVLMLILNAWIDHFFLQGYIQENQRELEAFQSDTSAFQSLASTVASDGSANATVSAETEIARLRQKQSELEQQLENQKSDLSELYDAAGRGWIDWVWGSGKTQEILDIESVIIKTENSLGSVII